MPIFSDLTLLLVIFLISAILLLKGRKGLSLGKEERVYWWTVIILTLITASGVSIPTVVKTLGYTSPYVVEPALILGLIALVGTLFVINLRNYRNKNPSDLKGAVRLTLGWLMGICGCLIAFGYSLVIGLMSLYWMSMTPIGAVFYGALFFSMVCALAFAERAFRNKSRSGGLRGFVLPIALMVVPYFLVVAIAVGPLL